MFIFVIIYYYLLNISLRFLSVAVCTAGNHERRNQRLLVKSIFLLGLWIVQKKKAFLYLTWALHRLNHESGTLTTHLSTSLTCIVFSSCSHCKTEQPTWKKCKCKRRYAETHAVQSLPLLFVLSCVRVCATLRERTISPWAKRTQDGQQERERDSLSIAVATHNAARIVATKSAKDTLSVGLALASTM